MSPQPLKESAPRVMGITQAGRYCGQIGHPRRVLEHINTVRTSQFPNEKSRASSPRGCLVECCGSVETRKAGATTVSLLEPVEPIKSLAEIPRSFEARAIYHSIPPSAYSGRLDERCRSLTEESEPWSVEWFQAVTAMVMPFFQAPTGVTGPWSAPEAAQ